MDRFQRRRHCTYRSFRAIWGSFVCDQDHLVPLKEAWLSGARDWTTARREALANDLIRPQLVAVTVGSFLIQPDWMSDQVMG